MLNYNKLIALFIFLFYAAVLCSQQSVQWSHELTNLPEDFKLEVAYMDSEDRLWLANQHGLWIFDGIECRSIHQFTLPSPISSMEVHSLDTIIIGTREGHVYSIIHDKMDTLPCPIGGTVSSIQILKHGSLWLGTSYDGLYHWDGQDCHHLTDSDGLPSNNISGMARDQNGNIWLATDNGLVKIAQAKNGDFQIDKFGSKNGLPDPLLNSVEWDSKKNRVLVSTHSKGVFSFQDEVFTPIAETSGLKHVKKVTLINDGKLFIEADSPQISILFLEENRSKVYPAEGKLSHPALYSQEGFVWYFTSEKQVHQKSIFFTKFNTPQTPQAILTDKSKIWIGTQNGLYWASTDSSSLTFRKVELFKKENIISLEFKADKILIGTFGNGLYLFDPKEMSSSRFSMEDGLPDQSILDIYRENDKVWLGTLGGLVLTQWEDDKMVSVENFVDTVYVYHIDKIDDRVYFSTHGDGAGYINGHIKWFPDSLLSTGEISTFGLLRGERSLFVTAKNGLIYFHEGNYHKIKSPTNISFETTSAIAADSLSQRFFISHTNGLDIFDPSDNSIIHLGKNLQLDFSTSALNAHTYDPYEQKHFFGSAGGFFCIEPGLYTYRSTPSLSILSCRINGEHRSIDGLQQLNSGERTLQLELLPIWYTDPRAVQFRYKIKGLHEQWIQTSDPKLVFTDLPYGDYQLEIQVGSYGDFSQQSGIKIPFHINYPLWMRWWFIITALVLIMLGIFGFIKNRENKLQRWARLEQEKANAQIQALKSQVSPHFMFNSFNTLIALIEEAPEKAVIYAENLSDFFRNLVSKRDRELSSLKEEVEMVDAYIHLLKTRFEDSLQASVEIEDWNGYIITYTLQILTENVVKHNIISRTQPLKFTIKREQNFIVIENNIQPKITKEESTGFGLESIRDRYKLLYKKDIIVQQSDDCFKVKVPIIQN